jgi:hypothetical protein
VENLGCGGTLAAMRVIRETAARTCSICERSLLVGEQAFRFSPDGREYLDVCPLCQEVALGHGWVREGSSLSPAVQPPARRRSLLASLLGAGPAEPEPIMSEPILRRLSDEELALVEAADLFNATQFRRTIAGVARALGPPKASIVPLSGVNAEVVLTFAWDITWYQYRVAPESGQPVRLAERGHDIDELEPSATGWNAQVDEDGRIVPNIEPL